ncbi:MAG TPA: 2-oxoglutarate dehydrogenase E1 component, partial [Nitrosospira sp.]|nr:2-oxoglutarate dehydrogenase E1 component [Nitrosospira sp.]
MMKQLNDNSPLFGSNASFVEGLYAAYLQEPSSVSAEWREYFDALQRGEVSVELDERAAQPAAIAQGVETMREEHLLTTERKQIAVLQMINAYRFLGVRHADLDPLKHYDKPHVPELDPGYYGLTEADMNTVFGTGSLFGPPRASLREILQMLRQTYCGKIGVEYMYITDTEQKRCIQNRIEGPRAQPDFEPEYKRHILERLTAAEGLEKYLHTRYVGQKRFSGEGGESIIPLLDNLLQRAGQMGVQQLVIGMAHRGRLNVLVNTLGKLPADLFQEFEGKHAQDLTEGDVKYHQGFSSAVSTPGGI